MKYFVLMLILSVSVVAQWTMSSGSNYVPPPPPPPPGNEPWRGILDYSRAADWSHVGVQGGIPTYTNDCGTVPPTGVRNWQANHVYNVGDKIADTRGNLQTVITAGTSGDSEPSSAGGVPAGSWQINPAIPTTDGSVVWQVTTSGGTDTANITNAIVACDGTRGIVHLTAGHYYLTRGIIFNKGHRYPQLLNGVPTGNPFWAAGVSYVLLKGAGPMQTYLHFTNQGPCASGDICVQASSAGFSGYAPTAIANPLPGGSAAWRGTTAQNVYNKGDATMMVGPWAGNAPDIGDTLFLDQNNDAVNICPPTPPATPYNCTVSGARTVGSTVTIVTSQSHGYHVGQCVGIGDITDRNKNLLYGYNSGGNLDKTTVCAEPPTSGLNPGLAAWWRITTVGCIVSGSFVDQSQCASNPIIAFQFDAGRQAGTCPINIGTVAAPVTVDCLADAGNGQATTDTQGAWLSSVGGATMTVGSLSDQSSRRCDNPQGNTAPNPACLPGEISIRSQFEAKTITDKVAGGQGSCTAPVGGWCYTIDPGLYMNNWRSSQRPGVWWPGKSNAYDGLEGFTYIAEHDPGDGTKLGIRFMNATNGWVRNTRGIDINRSFVTVNQSTRITSMDNYIGGTKGGASTAYVFEDNAAADTLMMNNICQHTVSCLMTSTVMGRVAAYNFMIDAGYSLAIGSLMPLMTMNHLAAFYNLFEGNDSAGIQTDNMHGTGGVSTAFRSRSRAQDLPNKATNRNGLSSSSNNRGLNYVGMLMGWPGLTNRYLDDNPANSAGGTDNTVFRFGLWRTNNGATGQDALSSKTSVRWGNYDAATQITRWCGDASTCSCGAAAVGQYCRLENETALPGYTFLAPNAVPADHNLPTSFFLTGPPYFWTTNWGTPGWPAMGPDVDASGSPLDTTCPGGITAVTGTGPGSFTRCDGIGHHAYQIPAQICYNNLPVDPMFQHTFAVMGAQWHSSGGSNNRPYVTLTIDNSDFAISANKAFTYTIEVTGVDPPAYDGTFQVETTPLVTGTSVSYWLAANPGSYNSGGTVTTPNYKQFDAHMCYPNLPY